MKWKTVQKKAKDSLMKKQTLYKKKSVFTFGSNQTVGKSSLLLYKKRKKLQQKSAYPIMGFVKCTFIFEIYAS